MMAKKVKEENQFESEEQDLLENDSQEDSNSDSEDDDSEDDDSEDDDSEDDDSEDDDSEDDDSEDDDSEDDDSEIVITIDGEESNSDEESRKAPKWVKDLRKANREQAKKIKELESKLSQGKPEEKKVTLGPKPTLEACDFDSDAYEKQLAEWYDKKVEVDKQELKEKARKEEEEKVWKQTVQTYEEKKKALKVYNFEEAEEAFSEVASQTQVGIIVQGAENPAMVIYALGRNTKKAKEICSIKDPVKFSFAVSKLEASLKVKPRKAKTEPEKVVSGKQGVSGSADKKLERLRTEAEKTGDYTKVTAYKRELKKMRK